MVVKCIFDGWFFWGMVWDLCVIWRLFIVFFGGFAGLVVAAGHQERRMSEFPWTCILFHDLAMPSTFYLIPLSLHEAVMIL
jgi:hypothetical protein